MRAWATALVLALAPAAGHAAAPAAEQIAKLVAPARQPSDRFGTSVAADGDRGVVGSMLATVGIYSRAGRTHALARSGGAWSVAADLDAATGAYYDRDLGVSAAIAGEFAVLGALETFAAGKGSVYAYNYVDPTGWALEAVVPAPNITDRNFGAAVAVSVDRILVSPSFSSPDKAGLAYAWSRSAPAVWTPLPTLTPTDTAPGDFFGAALSLDGDAVVIGAPGADESRGVAYVFTWDGAMWTQAAKLVAPDRQPGDIFGASVALGPTGALIGAPGRDGGAGLVFAFHRDGDEWTQTQDLPSDLPEAASSFGRAIALDDRHAVVTALDQGLDVNNPAIGGRGRALWYGQRDDGLWIPLAAIEADDGIPGDRLGFSVALEGPDALLGAPGDDGDLGAVYVFQLAQPDGAPCVSDDDCETSVCCQNLCTAPDLCSLATGGPDTTDSTGAMPDTSTGGGTRSPMLGIDPLQASGCACASDRAPERGAWLLLLLAPAVPRPRRRRGPLP